MADTSSTAPPADASNATTAVPGSEPTKPVEAPLTVAETSAPAEDATEHDEPSAVEVHPPESVDTSGPAAAAGVTPSSAKKRAAGVPEHKKNKGKRKSMPVLHLDCEPGDYYWARLKGHPPWPAIICDEQMLPESLLATRPVSTAAADGTVREDYRPGGKNARDRTFPIMFLSTNEFAWMSNTALTPLDPKECEKQTGKMSKALSKAYEIAAEGHDLDYFKNILKVWQEEQAQIEQESRELEEKLAQEEEERKQKAAEKAADDSKPKKKSRKSKGGETDVEMEDVEEPKSSKKRKKDAESDADGAKPKKTPKVTKINAPKTPNGEASASKKTAKPKKKIVTAPQEKAEEPETEEERLAKREKAILYLRHRLQKGFLTRDQVPQESEMDAMADFFEKLEAYEDLEPVIIRTTKIHKVLKAIVKLASIPKEEEYNFKKRSSAMLEIWNRRMEVDGGNAPAPAAEEKSSAVPETNGETHVNGDANGEAAKTEDETANAQSGEEKTLPIVSSVGEKLDKPTESTGDAVAPAPATDEAADSKPSATETAEETA